MTAALPVYELAALLFADTRADFERVAATHRYLRFAGELGDALERRDRRRTDVLRLMDRVTRDLAKVAEATDPQRQFSVIKARLSAVLWASVIVGAWQRELFAIDEVGGVA